MFIILCRIKNYQNYMLHDLKVYLPLFIGILFVNSTLSQERQTIQLYKFSNDLITNVTGITKDNKDFIWVSTQDGIFRFDSKTFVKVPISSNDKSEDPWTAIKKIFYDSTNNKLFAISSTKGLAILNHKVSLPFFQPLQLPINLRNIEITDIALFADNYLITSTQGIHYLKLTYNETEEKFSLTVLKSFNDVHARLFSKYSSNNFVIYTPLGQLQKYEISEQDGIQKILEVNLLENLGGTNEVYFLSVNSNSYFIGTDKGLYEIDKSGKSKNEWLPDQPVYAITTAGNYKFAAAGNGLYKIDIAGNINRIFINSTDLGDDWLSLIYSMSVDSDNLWLGTQNGLALATIDISPFYKIINTYKDNRNLNHVYHLGTFNEQLYLSTENGFYQWTNQSKLERIVDDATFFLNFTGPHNTHIVSGINSTYIIKGMNWVPYNSVFKEFNNYPHLSFNDFEYYNDSLIFLSTENEKGIFRWNYKSHKVTPLLETISSSVQLQQSNGLYFDRNKLFILTDSLIFQYNTLDNSLNKVVIYDKGVKNRQGLLFDMLKVRDKYYFSSYDNGVICTDTSFNTTKVFNTTNGLSNNGVYRILSVGDTSIFVSTNNGINLINIKTDIIKVISADQGLHSNTFEEFSALEKDGKLYFGGNGGVSIIDPEELKKIKTPKNNLTFLSYEVIDRNNFHQEFTLLDKERIVIKNIITQTRISFQNIIYPFNSRNKYFYKIEEIHEAWIDLGSKNFIEFISFTPGTYHLQVQAFNEDGVPSEIKELTLIFLPKWHQTLGFKILIGLILAAIFYGLYKFRINHLKKEEKIRIQVASDLHDELGSTLNSVKLFTNLAMMEKENTSHLEKIKEAAQTAIAGVKDIIWVLDDKRDTLDHLLSRISQFAKPLCEAAGISYKQQSGGNENYKLGKEEKRNLYMIFKESINNSIKYADCSVIELLIKNKGATLSISISDNGKGFDRNETTSGYGLKNIVRRAGEIGYHAEINSSPGNGTLIYLEKK